MARNVSLDGVALRARAGNGVWLGLVRLTAGSFGDTAAHILGSSYGAAFLLLSKAYTGTPAARKPTSQSRSAGVLRR